MNRIAYLSIFALIAVLSSNAHAAATCFCVISTDNLNEKNNATGVFINMTGEARGPFYGMFQQEERNQNICKDACKSTSESKGKPTIINAACAAQAAKGVSGLTPIYAYSAVGTRPYRIAAYFGEVLYKPEVKQTTCICPTGWLSNSSNAPNGVTTDGRCKKLYGTYTGPTFPNGTQIGGNNEAFMWGNEIWVYGSQSNGGKPFCSTMVTQPAICM